MAQALRSRRSALGSDSGPVPLVRAAQLAPFVEASERLGIRSERYLAQARLPGDILEHPQQLISRTQVWGFADMIAREQHLPDLGLRAATTDPLATLGGLGRQLVVQPTLFKALARLAREATRHSTHLRFGIEEIPQGIRVVRHDAGYVARGSEVVEQYTLMLLISVVRRAAPGWRPTRIWARSIGAEGGPRHELLAAAEPITAGVVTGIGVPRHLLARPLEGPERTGAGDADGLDAPDTFCGSLKHALEPLVGQVPLDLDLAAELVGVSPRTVRLRLGEEETSWRGLLDELRFEYARARLTRTHQRIAQIAFELGYADAAHFTRAFRRWTGVTPSALRAGAPAPR